MTMLHSWRDAMAFRATLVDELESGRITEEQFSTTIRYIRRKLRAGCSTHATIRNPKVKGNPSGNNEAAAGVSCEINEAR